MRRGLHLLARRQFVGMPGQRHVQRVFLAALGPAALIGRREFHHSARELGVFAALDFEAEALPADPGDPALLAWLPIIAVAPPLAEDVAHGPADALPLADIGQHQVVATIRFKAVFRSAIASRNACSSGRQPDMLACLASWFRLLPTRPNSPSKAVASSSRGRVGELSAGP